MTKNLRKPATKKLSAGVPARRLALTTKPRTFEARELNFWRQHGSTVCAVILGIIFACAFIPWLYRQLNPSIISPKGSSEVKTIEVRAEEPERYCGDAISYIRCSGEDLGKTNREIMTMIRIAKAESGFKETAKNKTSSATGVFQITWATWDSNRCEGEKWEFKDNIDCAWKIQTRRGYQPWEVCHTGVANCY